ncbi:uncharacterized protein LOC123262922 [Cotesia glomerata]|uniref:C2H2-type domain-containing protein n=1 Tax=Cotesia glomerata TaxID=32391 RepID=A0AAV7IMA6_COTGL|nr:uncharacterized protein LOC123262922 [Cotesia glomerata]KAH0553745.1 hypothetical protein KQX54_003867 [Cotesia glomerata]
MQNYEMLAHWARREIQAVTKLPTGSSQIANQEKNPRPFSCLQCGRNYMRKDSLMRHIKWECGKDPLFQCPFCPHRCKRKPHWLRHIRRQHKDSIGDMENYLHSYKPLPHRGPEHHGAEVGSSLAALECPFNNVAVWRRPGERIRRKRDRKPGGVQLSGLRARLQAEEQPEEPPEVGVRKGASVPVSPLRLPRQAEDAHREAHGADAQGEDLQAGARLVV